MASPYYCFKEGTLVLTEEGRIPIEAITSGMLVLAWDEESGRIESKEVVQLFRNETNKWIHIDAKV